MPQMVLSRLSFGYWGNILPAGLQAVVAGIGWFAVNSVSRRARAQLADRLAAGALPRHRVARSHPGAASHGGGLGGFLLTVVATFGYAASWYPYAAGYTRHLPPSSSRRAVGDITFEVGFVLSAVLYLVLGRAGSGVRGRQRVA